PPSSLIYASTSTDPYTLSLHDALPISSGWRCPGLHRPAPDDGPSALPRPDPQRGGDRHRPSRGLPRPGGRGGSGSRPRGTGLHGTSRSYSGAHSIPSPGEQP